MSCDKERKDVLVMAVLGEATLEGKRTKKKNLR